MNTAAQQLTAGDQQLLRATALLCSLAGGAVAVALASDSQEKAAARLRTTGRKHPLLQSLLQRAPMFLLALLVAMCTVTPFFAPVVFSVSLFLLNCIFVWFGIRSAVGIFFVWRGSVSHSHTDWTAKLKQELQLGGSDQTGADHTGSESVGLSMTDASMLGNKGFKLIHVIVIPNYKEDFDSLVDSLSVLASHSMAVTSYKVCLAMEAAEEGSEEKAQRLIRMFKHRFHAMICTVHSLVPGETRGKSSNVRHAVMTLANMPDAVPAAELVTVMDADTCFTADYFECITYHATIADPVTRRSQMYFAPVVFDRNTHAVNAAIRMIDIAWSSALMTMSMPYYPVRLALSTYSIPMELAIGIGYWDVTPEGSTITLCKSLIASLTNSASFYNTAMGEDFHTTLKCYLATGGRLKTIPVFSPSSQCHVDASSFWKSLHDRWVQCCRHAWAILDFSYGLRMLLTKELPRLPESYFQEWAVDPATGRKVNLYKPKSISGTFTLIMLYYHLYETFIFPVHIMFSGVLVALCLPGGGPAFLLPLENWIWSILSGTSLTDLAPVHPLIQQTLALIDQMRIVFIIPLLSTFVFFELFHEWVAAKRWQMPGAAARFGKRSVLKAGSRKMVYVAEWTLYLGVPIFMACSLLWAMGRHLVTDQLVYVVAAKPVVRVPFDEDSDVHPGAESCVDAGEEGVPMVLKL
ncbi:hypothetical protein CcCBS67573_g10125 [Chytriomyces confervae]|uniref:Glycosyltransferase 2-like domain-containing protein n=1 Tax=Chytriomyces confervae TaxID=246404 RepID=A0A507DE16_9FUNG|nr:hypothetical protein HDU80_010314 [Chytriomyces hyalinus]TPX49939.1 hypothetical protein CcCBS67573_g10125 [Chytriomyces confervae]